MPFDLSSLYGGAPRQGMGDYRARGMAAGQDMSWMDQPGALALPGMQAPPAFQPPIQQFDFSQLAPQYQPPMPMQRPQMPQFNRPQGPMQRPMPQQGAPMAQPRPFQRAPQMNQGPQMQGPTPRPMMNTSSMRRPKPQPAPGSDSRMGFGGGMAKPQMMGM